MTLIPSPLAVNSHCQNQNSLMKIGKSWRNNFSLTIVSVTFLRAKYLTYCAFSSLFSKSHMPDYFLKTSSFQLLWHTLSWKVKYFNNVLWQLCHSEPHNYWQVLFIIYFKYLLCDCLLLNRCSFQLFGNTLVSKILTDYQTFCFLVGPF